VLVGMPEDANDQTPGWPPPRFVGVFGFKAQANANASNRRGMKLLHEKDFAHAGDEFKKAIAADPRHVLAHYNLACVCALSGDHKAAIAELRWLAGAPEPAAAAALAKAKNDADLKSVLGDPEVKKLLGGGSCDDKCELKRDGCEQECGDRRDDAGLRGCARLCGSGYDECADSCGKK
jgi:tetratricopeptide (TPR) repeat protein